MLTCPLGSGCCVVHCRWKNWCKDIWLVEVAGMIVEIGLMLVGCLNLIFFVVFVVVGAVATCGWLCWLIAWKTC